MSLSNLKSVFEDEIKFRTEEFVFNRVDGINDSNLNFNTSVPFTHGNFSIDIKPPILDTLLRGQIYRPVGSLNSSVSAEIFFIDKNKADVEQPYLKETFDPRIQKNTRMSPFLNTNLSVNSRQYGVKRLASNPTDFSSAGVGNNPFIPLSQLGESPLDGLSWENLYNSNHTPKDEPSHKGLTPISYPNVNRDNLTIGSNETIYGDRTGARGFERGNEPYIVSGIGLDGREKNRGGRSTPLTRSLTDIDRLVGYFSSEQGIASTLYPNVNFFIPNTVIRKGDELKRVPQRFNNGYNPLSAAVGAFRPFGNNVPFVFSKSGINMGGSDGSFPFIPNPLNFKNYGDGKTVSHDVNITFGGATENGGGFFNLSDIADNLTGKVRKFYDGDGDKATLQKPIKGSKIMDNGLGVVLTSGANDGFDSNYNPEDKKDGMPFYFKDLRDNSYIFFRAYIEGLSENINPSWASHNYMGRSEPVWVYERAERELNFTLKLVAQTRKELNSIYEKMERLTSLCYPQYVGDIQNYGLNRMKAPLTRMRYGELYGKSNNELLGYVKSISYSIDQSSTYETEVGARVPRHIIATIGYQVIHNESPSLNMSESGRQKFYGINK
jgi:hypothetical protein